MADSNLEVVRRQFNRQAEAYAATPGIADRNLLEPLADVAGVAAADRVLDVACGPGFLTLELATRAASVVGIDVTERFLARVRAAAASQGASNVRLVRGDVACLPFGDALFDVVTCRFAFHHFSDAPAVLVEMRRVTRAGGRIAIVDMVTSEDREVARRHNDVERLCDPSHARAFPASELEALFADAGLVRRSVFRGEASYPLDVWIAHGGPPPEAAAEIRRRLAAWPDGPDPGIRISRTDGDLVFTHYGATWVLQVPAER